MKRAIVARSEVSSLKFNRENTTMMIVINRVLNVLDPYERRWLILQTLMIRIVRYGKRECGEEREEKRIKYQCQNQHLSRPLLKIKVKRRRRAETV